MHRVSFRSAAASLLWPLLAASSGQNAAARFISWGLVCVGLQRGLSLVLASVSLLLLSACGGGGSSAPQPAVPAGVGTPNALTPLVYVAVSPSVMFEDAPGVMTFTIALDRPSTTDTVVTYTLAGTATRDTDYTTTATGIATIPAGAGSATFAVDPTADSVFEPNETVVVGLVAVTAGSAALSPLASSATATITNDDAAAGRQERVGRAVYDAGTKIVSFITTANDGSDTVRLDFAPNRFVSNPRWSPDGKKIAFFDLSNPHPITLAITNNRVYALMVMNADGTNERRVAWATEGSLDWHPNSIHLLFTYNELVVTKPGLSPLERGYFYVVDTLTERLTFSPKFIIPPVPPGTLSAGDQTLSVRNALWRNPGSSGWPQTVIFTTFITTCEGEPIRCWSQFKISTQSIDLDGVDTPVLHVSNAPINLLHNALPVPLGADRTDSMLRSVSVNGEVIVFQKSFQRVGALPTQEQSLDERLILYTTATPFVNSSGVPSLQVDSTILPSTGFGDFSPDGKKLRYLNAVYDWQKVLAELKGGTFTQAPYLGLFPAMQLSAHWYLAP
jgi:hypothetical protein